MARSTSRAARLVAGLALTAAMLGSHAAPARAFNASDCVGPGNVVDVDTIQTSAGRADFGDLPHIGGAAQGTAVVCWYDSGRVYIRGRLFVDSVSRTCVTATIEFISRTVTRQRYSVCGSFARSTMVSSSVSSVPAVREVIVRPFVGRVAHGIAVASRGD